VKEGVEIIDSALTEDEKKRQAQPTAETTNPEKLEVG
jgi:hypothetical protein